MVRMTITYRGRKVHVELPDKADIEVSLEDELPIEKPSRIHPQTDALKNAGPSGRKLYRWIVDILGIGATGNIDPILVEAELGLVPIALGRTLGALERCHLIEVIHRRKEDRSRVVSYKIKVMEVEGPIVVDEQGSMFSNFVGDIEEAHGRLAGNLFKTLCREADIDGQTLLASMRVLTMKMVPIPHRFPTEEILWLEKGDWISILDREPLHVSILAWDLIKNDAQTI